MIFDFDKTEPSDRYKLTAQTAIPRPIAWIITKDKSINIAPFSYFTPLSSNPPTLIVSIGHKSSGEPKDTLRNIRNTKKCTICIAGETQLEKLHFSSKELDANISEAKEFDVKLKEAEVGFPPMVEGSPVAYFCEFYEEIDLKGSETIPIILEIKKLFVDDSAITDSKKLRIDFNPLARVGANYGFIGEKILAPKIP
ncbi:MAG: flavin reductase family protein [Sulfurospirillum sp.]